MAMTAALALSPSSAIINQQVKAVLTVSNSGGTDVNVTSVNPFVYSTGGANLDSSSANVGPAFHTPSSTVTVPAGGSLTFTFGCVFYASSGSSTYSVSAVVYSNDGSSFSPTPVTIAVSAIS